MLIYAAIAALMLLARLLNLWPRVDLHSDRYWNNPFKIEMMTRTSAREPVWMMKWVQEVSEDMGLFLIRTALGFIAGGIALLLGAPDRIVFGAALLVSMVMYLPLRNSAKGYRMCEYIGHAAQYLWSLKHQPDAYTDLAEIADEVWRHNDDNDGQMAEITVDQAEAGIRFWMPFARLVLVIAGPRIRKHSR